MTDSMLSTASLASAIEDASGCWDDLGVKFVGEHTAPSAIVVPLRTLSTARPADAVERSGDSR